MSQEEELPLVEIAEQLWARDDVRDTAIRIVADSLSAPKPATWALFWPPAWPALLLQFLGLAGGARARKYALRAKIRNHLRAPGLADSAALLPYADAIESALLQSAKEGLFGVAESLQEKRARGERLTGDEEDIVKAVSEARAREGGGAP